MFLNRRYNTDGLHAPIGDFDLNLGSPQAQDLVMWHPKVEGTTLPNMAVRPLSQTLTYPGVPPPTGSRHGTVLEFDGSAGYINYDTTGTERPIQAFPFTLACWFQSFQDTTFGCLMTVVESAVTNKYHEVIIRGDLAGDPISIISRNTTSRENTTTTGYTLGGWHHACGVFRDANFRTVYIDGGSSAVGTGGAALGAATRINFGALNRSSGPIQFHNGLIHAPSVWNRALSDEEVWRLYDPSSRWDLWHQRSTKLYYFPVVVAAPAGGPKGPFGHPFTGAFGGPL